jgi:thioredoxin 1
MHTSLSLLKIAFLGKTFAVALVLVSLAAAQNADSVSPLPRPTQMHAIYSDSADAKAEIAEALKHAQSANKRVILVFGGNWCFDCHVLDAAFQDAQIRPLVDANYEVIHVDVGRFDKNLDVAKKYRVNIARGVPALAVLAANGDVVFSDKGGEFEAARRMTRAEVVSFLNKWKPQRKS